MAELNYNEWAAVASREPELLSEHIERTIDTNPKPEPPNYNAMIAQMVAFNETDYSEEATAKRLKSIYGDTHQIVQRMKDTEGAGMSKSQQRTALYLEKSRRSSSLEDIRDQFKPYRG